MAYSKILTVVFETDQYLVVDKPAELDSQNSRPDRPSVVDWLKQRHPTGFAGLVHRLDFGVSGLMVCAKTPEAAAELTDELQSGTVKRRYLAVLVGKILPASGTLDFPIDDKTARTHYKVVQTFANASLVEVELETGRKHQIRRHFFEAGHPLMGDHLYKKKGSDLLFHRPALHAYQLTVKGKTHSTELPKDIQDLLARLRKG